ncbi:hypothetical protein [Ectobacillus ponti]|uniref:Uncharacterized protein n=1 Tax=Ectobacillus ponti TaxID=2961894 RepID=A0AA41X969_9BACI|nr:hypothetical protein [Ectobacillus ponti]MCP8968685.1 hypothetical protein [Ectobacillus ponti]
MTIYSIIFGLLSFFASMLILYTFGLFLPIEWLHDDGGSASFWLPCTIGGLIGLLIIRKYKKRLG